MSVNESQIIVLSIYTILFICIVTFFEMRLNYIHRRHIEKLWPIGEDGLKIIDQKLKIIVRVVFILLYILSVVTIFTFL